MAEITPIFSEYVYNEHLNGLARQNDAFLRKSLEIKQVMPNGDTWLCDTYNSLGSYDLHNDSLMSVIIDATKLSVWKYTEHYGVHANHVQCTDAWVNVSEKNSFQEYHLHSMSHFSAVYYVSVPENSGDLVLRSAETQTDMFPLPDGEQCLATNKTFSISPTAGDLVIFRSNVLHMVTKNYSDDPRVSVAMNFIIG